MSEINNEVCREQERDEGEMYVNIKKDLECLKGEVLNMSEVVQLKKIFNKKIVEFGKLGYWGDVKNETIAVFLEFVVGIPYGMVNDVSPNRLTDKQIKVLWEKHNRESEII